MNGQGAVRVSVPPRATEPPPERPEPVVMVTELAERRLVPIVEVAPTAPVMSVKRSAPRSPEMLRFVEEAVLE